MRESNYPVFAPPLPFAAKSGRDWTPEEATAFLRWTAEILEVRTDALAVYFGERIDNNSAETVLKRIGPAVKHALTRFSQERELPSAFAHAVATRRLSVDGLSLAADLGLLMARLLLRD